MLKIAVLSWSPIVHGPMWHLDGPCLRIEFVKTSPEQELMPVLCDKPWVEKISTSWAEYEGDDHKVAQLRIDCARREHIDLGDVGLVKDVRLGKRASVGSKDRNVGEEITKWAQQNDLDAVIWNDSRADDTIQSAPDLETAKRKALEYLKSLPADAQLAALTYMRWMPSQISTPIRTYIDDHRQSLRPTADAKTRIMTVNDLQFEDWKECRATVTHLDTILLDLRKTGFAFVTGLLTANAYLDFLGIPTGQTGKETPVPAPEIRAAAFIVTMALVAALFSIDTHYQVLRSAAAERALDLESLTSPQIRVTKYLSTRSSASKVSYMVLFLYLVLLATAAGLGLLITGELRLTFPWLLKGTLACWAWAGFGGVIASAVLFIMMIAVRSIWRPRPDWLLLAGGALLGLLCTGGMAAWLMASTIGNNNAPIFIIGLGAFLALYIEWYWAFVAYQSRLHRLKPSRIWPEGKELVP